MLGFLVHNTVFMPSVPTLLTGAVFTMPTERVNLIDVPVITMMKCITRWGSGNSEPRAAMPHL